MTYTEIKQSVINDIGSSFWVKNALVDLEKRDIIDAMNDVNILSIALKKKWEEIKNQRPLK